MKIYQHKVQYYETDRMGVTHHSNYIRWMEEARMDFLTQIGYPYEQFEAEGLMSPVTSVTCKYQSPTTFGDEVCIHVKVKAFNGVRLILGYDITKRDTDTIVCTGTSEHCFLTQDYKFIRLKAVYPDLTARLMACIEA